MENCNCRYEKPSCDSAHYDYRGYDALDGLPIAMAYVPWQHWKDVYDLCEGLEKGTIFPELYKPFIGRGVR